MMRNKCLGCTQRQPGCHVSCSSYLEYRESIEKAKSNKKKQEVYINYLVDQYTNSFVNRN